MSRYSYHHGFYDGIEREFRGFARVDQLDAESVPAGVRHRPVHRNPGRRRRRLHPPAGTHPDLVPHRRLLRRRRHRRPPEQRVLPAGPASPASGRHRPPRRGEQRGVPPGLPGAAGPGAAPGDLRRGRHTGQRQPVRHQRAPLPGRPSSSPPSAPRTAGVYAWELESITLPLRAQPRRPADHPPADPRRRRLRQRDQQRHGRLRRAGRPRSPSRQRRWSPTRKPTSPTSPTSPAGTGSACRSRPAPTSSPAWPRPRRAAATTRPACWPRPRRRRTSPTSRRPPGRSPQRRLLKRTRTIYRRDDLSGPLPLGQVESLALVDATYHLVYTPGLLSADLRRQDHRGSARRRAQPARARTWTSTATAASGRPRRGRSTRADPAHPDPVFAAQHFYLPQGAARPVGQPGHASTTTPRPARHARPPTRPATLTQAASNYRVLAPWLVTDANLNRNGVRYDPLGHGHRHRGDGQAASRRHRRRRPPRHHHGRAVGQRRPHHPPRLRPGRLPDLGGRPQPRPRPPRPGVGTHQGPGPPPGPRHTVAGDLHLHRRPRPGRAHQGPGRARRRPAARRRRAAAAQRRRLPGHRPHRHPLGGHRACRLRQQGQPGQSLRAVLRQQPGL